MNYADYAVVFRALSDETRLKITEMLVGGELCACKILESLSITQPTLSYHMKILCDSGLVKGRRDGAWMRYSLSRNKIALLTKFFMTMNHRSDLPK
ncbi:MAG: transcriptional regulator [Firmicutes bacterium HGW-Firmicutes-21]|nr:MAG: transcriptional regulator [Firmicutes bacterium HGW-Firmicutes-21]